MCIFEKLCKIKTCMFGSIFIGTKIDYEGVELILKCLVASEYNWFWLELIVPEVRIYSFHFEILIFTDKFIVQLIFTWIYPYINYIIFNSLLLRTNFTKLNIQEIEIKHAWCHSECLLFWRLNDIIDWEPLWIGLFELV